MVQNSKFQRTPKNTRGENILAAVLGIEVFFLRKSGAERSWGVFVVSGRV